MIQLVQFLDMHRLFIVASFVMINKLINLAEKVIAMESVDASRPNKHKTFV